MNIVARYIARYFFKILYTLGLTFVILFFLTANTPSELGIWHGTPETLAGVALLLLIIGIMGVYSTCKRSWPKALRNLGLWTLIPGVIALVASLYSLDFIYSFLQGSAADPEVIKPILDSYVERRAPKIWILTASYIIIGLFLYISGLREKFLRK